MKTKVFVTICLILWMPVFVNASRGAYMANEQIYAEGKSIMANNWRKLIVKNISSATTISASRTWHDKSGRELIGEFVKLEEEKIILKVAGKEFIFPLSELGLEDQRVARLLVATEAPGESPLILTVTGYGGYGQVELILGSSLRNVFLKEATSLNYIVNGKELTLNEELLSPKLFRENYSLKGIFSFRVESIETESISIVFPDSKDVMKSPTAALSKQAIDFLNLFSEFQLFESTNGSFLTAEILSIKGEKIKVKNLDGLEIEFRINQLNQRHSEYINAISTKYSISPPRFYFYDGHLDHFSFFRCLVPLERKLFALGVNYQKACHLMSIHRSAYLNDIPSFEDEKGAARVYAVDDKDKVMPIHRFFLDPPPHGGLLFFPKMRSESKKDFISVNQFSNSRGYIKFDISVSDMSGKVLQSFTNIAAEGLGNSNKFDASLEMIIPLRIEKSLRHPQTIKLIHSLDIYSKSNDKVTSTTKTKEYKCKVLSSRFYIKP